MKTDRPTALGQDASSQSINNNEGRVLSEIFSSPQLGEKERRWSLGHASINRRWRRLWSLWSLTCPGQVPGWTIYNQIWWTELWLWKTLEEWIWRSKEEGGGRTLAWADNPSFLGGSICALFRGRYDDY